MADSELYVIIKQGKKLEMEETNMKEEMTKLDEDITWIKAQNKEMYTSEYELINKVLNYEKKLLEIMNQKQKNTNTINILRNEHNTLCEKLNGLLGMKAKIVETQRKKRICLIRKAYKIQQFLEDHGINKELENLDLRDNTEIGHLNLDNNNNDKDSDNDNESNFYQFTKELKLIYSKLLNRNEKLRKEIEFNSANFIDDYTCTKRELFRTFSSILQNFREIEISSFSDSMGVEEALDVTSDVLSQFENVTQKETNQNFQLGEEIKRQNLTLANVKKNVKELVSNFYKKKKLQK